MREVENVGGAVDHVTGCRHIHRLALSLCK